LETALLNKNVAQITYTTQSWVFQTVIVLPQCTRRVGRQAWTRPVRGSASGK